MAERDSRGRWTRSAIVARMGPAPRLPKLHKLADMTKEGRERIAKALARVSPLAADAARTLAAHYLAKLAPESKIRDVARALGTDFGGGSAEEIADSLEAIAGGAPGQTWGSWARGAIDNWANAGLRAASHADRWARGAQLLRETSEAITGGEERAAGADRAAVAARAAAVAAAARTAPAIAAAQAHLAILQGRQAADRTELAAIDAAGLPNMSALKGATTTARKSGDAARLKRAEDAEIAAQVTTDRADELRNLIRQRAATIALETAQLREAESAARAAVGAEDRKAAAADEAAAKARADAARGPMGIRRVENILNAVARGAKTAAELRDLLTREAARKAQFSNEDWEDVDSAEAAAGQLDEFKWGKGGGSCMCSSCRMPIQSTGACACGGSDVYGGRAIWRPRRRRGRGATVGGGPLSDIAGAFGLGSEVGGGPISGLLGAFGLGAEMGGGPLSDIAGAFGLGSEVGGGPISGLLGAFGLGAEMGGGPLSDIAGAFGLGSEVGGGPISGLLGAFGLGSEMGGGPLSDIAGAFGLGAGDGTTHEILAALEAEINRRLPAGAGATIGGGPISGVLGALGLGAGGAAAKPKPKRSRAKKAAGGFGLDDLAGVVVPAVSLARSAGIL